VTHTDRHTISSSLFQRSHRSQHPSTRSIHRHAADPFFKPFGIHRFNPSSATILRTLLTLRIDLSHSSHSHSTWCDPSYIGVDPCRSPFFLRHRPMPIAVLHGALSPGTMSPVRHCLALSHSSPGMISVQCWMIKRSVCLLKQISHVEIASTCSAATSHGCRSSGVFHAVDSAALQPVHRCTPAPCGTLAAPAVLPTVCK